MPARLVYECCCCALCVEEHGIREDGTPVGGQIRSSHMEEHLAICEAFETERRVKEDMLESFRSAVESEFLLSTVRNDEVHRLRNELPDEDVPPYESDDGGVLSSIRDLYAALPDVISIPKALNISDECNRIRQNKREKHRATLKAHLLLDKVERLLLECFEFVKSGPTNCEELLELEKKLSQSRCLFEISKRITPSLNERRRKMRGWMDGLDSQYRFFRNTIPTLRTEPRVIDTEAYISTPLNSHDILSQLATFITLFCHIICSVGRNRCSFIMSSIQLLLGLALCRSGKLDSQDRLILDQVPNNLDGAMKKIKLDGEIVLYAVCPKCNSTYPPENKLGSSIASYKLTCDRYSTADVEPCGEKLVATRKIDSTIRTFPIKSFAYHSFIDFVASLLSRSDVELDIENSLDSIINPSTGTTTEGPRVMKNIFDGSFIRNFRGPDGERLFADRQGNTHLLFALFIDFFNVNTVLHRGASTSNGVIAMACLNLPMEKRYLPENMYLSGIIPGPNEPSLNELNHFIEPLVNDLVEFWNPGIKFSHTSRYRNQLVRCAIACIICDLPAARKTGGFAGVTSHNYCTLCHCHGKQSLTRTDYHNDDWRPKNPIIVRSQAEAWRDADIAQQKSIFQSFGTRYSILWKLPYINLPMQLVPDPMHCLLENLTSRHFRDYLQFTKTASKNAEKESSTPAFSHLFVPFSVERQKSIGSTLPLLGSPKLQADMKSISTVLETSSQNENPLSPDVLFGLLRKFSLPSLQAVFNERRVVLKFKEVRKNGKPRKDDFAWSLAHFDEKSHVENQESPVPLSKKEFDKLSNEVKYINEQLTKEVLLDDSEDPEWLYFRNLHRRLEKKSLTSLEFIAGVLNVSPLRDRPVPELAQRIIWRKSDFARGLIAWRKTKPYRSTIEHHQVITNGPSVLVHINDVIRDTELPSWVYGVPKGFGESRTGTLKADEWRGLSLIHIPFSLVSLWGESRNSEHSDEHTRSVLRAQLDHTMKLIQAIQLACYRDTSRERAELFGQYMKSYLDELLDLHPHATRVCNQHMSLHLPLFLEQFGPVYSWWSFAFERLIGRLQRMPTNNKFGELEPTLLRSFIKAGRLRSWLNRSDAPLGIKECAGLLEKFLPKRKRGTSVEEAIPVTELDGRDEVDEDWNEEEGLLNHLPSLFKSAISQGEKIVFKNTLLHKGTRYSVDTTHLGNSNVIFQPNSSRQPTPGRIRFIYIRADKVRFVISRHLAKDRDFIDPFIPYVDYPAKIFSSNYSSTLDDIDGDRIVAHFARWSITDKHSVVLSLSKFGNVWV